MLGPTSFSSVFAAIGPCTCIGCTSGSETSASSPAAAPTPSAYSPASESASCIHHVSFFTCSSTGSFTIEPSGPVTSMYLPCFTAHFVRSRQVIMSISRSASGPATCTVRSTPTSHIVTPLLRAQYSVSGSS
jgi:hypothetical protein